MICIDSSVCAKWLFDEEDSDKALALIDAVVAEAQAVIAPLLLPLEIANVIRQRGRAGVIDADTALKLLENFHSYAIHFQWSPENDRLALQIATDYNLPSSYDAHYVALAQTFGCVFWTADGTLVRRLGGPSSSVRLLNTYDA